MVDNPYDAAFEDELESGDAFEADDVEFTRRSPVVRIVAALCAAALFLSAGSVLAVRIFTSAAGGPCDGDPVTDFDFTGRDVHDARQLLDERELSCNGEVVELRVVSIVACRSGDVESNADQLRDRIARADELRTDGDTGQPVLRVVVCGDALSV